MTMAAITPDQIKELRELTGAEWLSARNPSQLEIERKYLLKKLPDSMPESRFVTIEQGYLPGERLVERLRAIDVDRRRTYFRTVKVGAGLVRTELEEETTAEVFKSMWPLTKGKRLTKRRHRVPDGSETWEIDEFTDRDLVLAEIDQRSDRRPALCRQRPVRRAAARNTKPPLDDRRAGQEPDQLPPAAAVRPRLRPVAGRNRQRPCLLYRRARTLLMRVAAGTAIRLPAFPPIATGHAAIGERLPGNVVLSSHGRNDGEMKRP